MQFFAAVDWRKLDQCAEEFLLPIRQAPWSLDHPFSLTRLNARGVLRKLHWSARPSHRPVAL
jgi:hypothetical protein